MRKAVEDEPESSLMQADEEAWAEALAHHYAADCPVLKTNDVWQEQPERRSYRRRTLLASTSTDARRC